MKYRVLHETKYQYSEPASLSHNEVCLQPRETFLQKVSDHVLRIVPEPARVHLRRDYFGNWLHSFMLQQPHDELIITSESVLETANPAVLDPLATIPWETAVQRLCSHASPEELEAYQYVFESPLTPASDELSEFTNLSFPPGAPLLSAVLDLTARINTDFTYAKATTTVDTPIEQVLEKRQGVCQDFAHLQIAGLRMLGLAARYVSGYLETAPPAGKPKLRGADASHAWLGVYIPDLGWVDVDPTNNVIPGEKHITIAWGRDYGDVTPAKGVVMGGGLHELSVAVDVMPAN